MPELRQRRLILFYGRNSCEYRLVIGDCVICLGAKIEFSRGCAIAKCFEIGQSLGGIKESESGRLLVTENTARGEPVAHRGVFGRRGRAPFGEFLALFRQQFH